MDNTYVSKDNGLTWTKRVGNSLTRSVYGGKFVDVGTSLSLITKRNQRTDGSSISPDVITIGHEGATTVIGDLVVSKINGPSGAISISSNINVSMGLPTTLFSFTPKSLPIQYTRIAYGGGKFVMVGDQGRVYHSSDGTTWTQATNISFSGGLRNVIYAKDKFMLVTEDIPSKVYTTGDGGANWLLVNPSPAPTNQVYRAAYGNDYVVAINAGSGNISVSNNLAGTAWSNTTLSGINIYGVTFGSMSNGTKVFIVHGTNNIRRNTETTLIGLSTSGNWSPPSTPPGDGGWQYGAFGNDTFMVTSGSNLTISRDGGVTWSVPISFGILVYFPIYVEGEWYIGSENGFIMISKNNGLTWEKKATGTDIYDFAYGKGLLVGVNYRSTTNNQFNLIGLKKIADDGSLIMSDAITIGREGTTTEIKGSCAISQGLTLIPFGDTANHLTFSRNGQFTMGIGPEANPTLIMGAATNTVNIPGGLTASSLSLNGNTYFIANSTNNDSSRDIIINSMIVPHPVSSPAIVWNNNYYPGIKLVYRSKSWSESFIAFETTGKTGDTTPSVAPTITDKAFCINTYSGYVGIGTTTPTCPLDVNGTSTVSTPSGYTFFANNSGSLTKQNLTSEGSMTIRASNNILAGNAFVAASDRRIKTNIVAIDDDSALRDLRLLKPKTYTYTDVLQKGTTPVYGFIAQEVKEILNYASSPITETVPNVYELATFSGDTLTLMLNTADLSRDPSGALFPRLKLKTREEKDEFVNILEILDAHTLRVDKDLTGWGGELVGDQIVPGNRIFVYGQEVSDFHTLNKDAIWTVATAALQEVDRQLQAEKQKTAAMQTALDALLERVNALEQKTSV